MTRPGEVINKKDAIIFLDKAERYFKSRPTGGEDRAHWANVYNAENCRKVINLLEALNNGPTG